MQNKPHFFFWKQGFPKGGERGGGPTLGKNSQKIPFFFMGSVPYKSVSQICGTFYNFVSRALFNIPYQFDSSKRHVVLYSLVTIDIEYRVLHVVLVSA